MLPDTDISGSGPVDSHQKKASEQDYPGGGIIRGSDYPGAGLSGGGTSAIFVLGKLGGATW